MATTSILLLAATLTALPAAPLIRYHAGARLWTLEGGGVSYVLGVNERNELQHVYWGKLIPDAQDWKAAHSYPQWDGVDPSTTTTPEEYPGWGGLRYFEPCLKVILAGGVRDIVLKYVDHEIRGPELVIHLADSRGRLAVDLAYRIYPDGIIRKQATVRNTSKTPVMLESLQSGAWQRPENDSYRLTYLSGRWAEETLLTQTPIQRGSKIIESRRGNTSNQSNPWFAIDGPDPAGEEHGEVWFGALGWSGSWKITVEQTPQRGVRITGGMHDFDFAQTLAPGGQLTTPPFYGGFTDARLRRSLPSAPPLRVGRNPAAPLRASACARSSTTPGKLPASMSTSPARRRSPPRPRASASNASSWTTAGSASRDTDRAGLGDWTSNPRKFPHGLQPLIAYVKRLGMDFGLWVEPEMVNPDSDLYRAHPDWVMQFSRHAAHRRPAINWC